VTCYFLNGGAAMVGATDISTTKAPDAKVLKNLARVPIYAVAVMARHGSRGAARFTQST
jgi:hypothetical protein